MLNCWKRPFLFGQCKHPILTNRPIPDNPHIEITPKRRKSSPVHLACQPNVIKGFNSSRPRSIRRIGPFVQVNGEELAMKKACTAGLALTAALCVGRLAAQEPLRLPAQLPNAP